MCSFSFPLQGSLFNFSLPTMLLPGLTEGPMSIHRRMTANLDQTHLNRTPLVILPLFLPPLYQMQIGGHTRRPYHPSDMAMPGRARLLNLIDLWRTQLLLREARLDEHPPPTGRAGRQSKQVSIWHQLNAWVRDMHLDRFTVRRLLTWAMMHTGSVILPLPTDMVRAIRRITKPGHLAAFGVKMMQRQEILLLPSITWTHLSEIHRPVSTTVGVGCGPCAVRPNLEPASR